MVKTVLWDVGGVLIFYSHATIAEVVRKHAQTDFEETRAILFDSDAHLQYEQGTITTEQYFSFVKTKMGFTDGFDQFAELFTIGFGPNIPLEGIVRGMQKNNLAVAAVSNTTPLHYQHLTRKYPVLQAIDVHVPSYIAGAKKPDQQHFDAAMRATESRPDHCLFIDDLQENVDAARVLGMEGIVYKDPAQLRSELKHLGVPHDLLRRD